MPQVMDSVAGERFELVTTNGFTAVIDAELTEHSLCYSWTDGDQMWFSVHDVRWTAVYCQDTKSRYVHGSLSHNGRKRSVALHRLVTQCPPHMIVDHANHDTLDNRLSNLRLATKSTNMMNSARRRNSTGFRGVKTMGPNDFMCQVGFRGQKIYGGRHKTPEAAARAYDRIARELHGEFAQLNFPISNN